MRSFTLISPLDLRRWCAAEVAASPIQIMKRSMNPNRPVAVRFNMRIFFPQNKLKSIGVGLLEVEVEVAVGWGQRSQLRHPTMMTSVVAPLQ